MDVGFIGLGAMGRAMAANLIKAGHALKVWNRTAAAAETLLAAGATRVETPAEAATGDVVITMLADDTACWDVVLGTGGLLQAAGPNTIHVNMATISIALAIELETHHAGRGIAYVAAPVFGRPEAAAAAMLNILAAGSEAALSRVQPLFDAMGQKTWRLGAEPRRANAVKLAGNLMIGAAIHAMAEGTALGLAHGVSARDFLNIVTSTIFASPVYKGYGAAIAADTYEPAGFKLRLGLKDIRLALAAGDAADVPLPFGSALRDTLIEALGHGDGDKDLAALARVVHRHAGVGGA